MKRKLYQLFRSYVILLRLAGTFAEVARHGGHASAPPYRGSCVMHTPFLPVQALDNDHQFFATRSRVVSLGVFSRPGPISSEITLLTGLDPGASTRDQIAAVSVVVSCRSPFHPRLIENSLSGDKVFPGIAHDPAKSPITKRIQTATFTGSDAPSFTTM